MKRIALVAASAALVIPGGSAMAASTGTGVVLSVGHGTVQLVNSAHQVGAYRLRRGVRGLRRGSVVSFAASHGVLRRARIIGHTDSLTFLGDVVSSGSSGVRLLLGDGNTVAFSSHEIKSAHRSGRRAFAAALRRADAAGISITVNAPPGTTVLVTETFGPGGVLSITLTIASGESIGSGSGSSSGSGAGDLTVNGVVSDIENDNFAIVTGNGTVMRFQMNATELANENMNPCDVVDVSYHEGTAGGLVADAVDDDASSDAGSCDADGTYYPTEDETGPITAISATSITIDTSDQGSMSFPVNETQQLTSGFLLGDVVDVTYEPVPDGTNYVTDIEYVENDSAGVVTALNAGSLTITDDATGQPDVFAADPSLGMFEGVALGDQVDVTWHEASNNVEVADNVQDMGSASPWWVRVH